VKVRQRAGRRTGACWITSTTFVTRSDPQHLEQHRPPEQHDTRL
jgi:hypothetical protein